VLQFFKLGYIKALLIYYILNYFSCFPTFLSFYSNIYMCKEIQVYKYIYMYIYIYVKEIQVYIYIFEFLCIDMSITHDSTELYLILIVTVLSKLITTDSCSRTIFRP